MATADPPAAPGPTAGPGDVGATCPRHPGTAATLVCARCGSYGCEACLTGTATAGVLCPPCLGLAGLDHLDAFVAAHRGRRDAFVWWLGLGGAIAWFIPSALTAINPWLGASSGPVVGRAVGGVALGVAAGGIHLAYLSLRRLSRVAIFVPTALGVLFFARAAAAFHTPATLITLAFYGVILVLLARAFVSPLNRLAFGLEVPRPRLEAAYRRYRANRLAVLACVLAVPAAIVPFTFLLVLPLAGLAWWRSRQPGIGHRRTALAALVLLGIGFGVTVVAMLIAAA